MRPQQLSTGTSPAAHVALAAVDEIYGMVLNFGEPEASTLVEIADCETLVKRNH